METACLNYAPTIEEAYTACKATIHKAIHSFLRSHPGNFEDLELIANERFVVAYRKFDTDRGTNFLAYLYRYVIGGLLEEWRRPWRRIAHTYTLSSALMDSIMETPPKSGFDVTDFALGLGQDAKIVAKMILDSPAEIAALAELKGGEARNYRSTIKDYLRGIGWGAARIAESFAEIKIAMMP